MINSEFQMQGKALNEIIEKLTILLSASPIVPQHLTLTLREVSDGYISPSSDLVNQFAQAAGRNISEFLSFQAMPISNSIENYKEPLILISDEAELDAGTSAIIRRRHDNGYVTFPVILFSDQFFQLVYGQCCSYLPIIETYEAASSERVMVFRKSDYLHIYPYLICVSNLIRIHLVKKVIDESSQYLHTEIETTEKLLMSSEEKFDSLALVCRCRAVLQLCSEIDSYNVKLVKNGNYWRGIINVIREDCDRKVDEVINQIIADRISPFALHVDLKYGRLRRYVYTFLHSVQMKNHFGNFEEDIRDLKEKTERDIMQNAGKLSLIGTFSSGKTTLINTFLGERDIPLKTSAEHNTAVLMHLYYEQSEQEYYDIIYRDKLIWTVVKPETGEKEFRNLEKCCIRIQSVEKMHDGYHLRYILEDRSRQSREVTFRTSAPLAIGVGDKLQPGEAFTKRVFRGNANIELCPRQELELLIRLLQSAKSFSITTLEGIKSYPINSNIAFLQRCLTIAGKKRSVIPYSKLCEALGIPKGKSGEYPSIYRRFEVTCSLNLKNERRRLDRQGWIKLCGDPNTAKSSQNSQIPFSEKPECYMLAKELQLHVHSEFLEYCTLTDTPGFGSVTEEHDAITEHYIRDHSGRLLVMIAINAKTVDAKYQDLINSINDLYNNFRKNDKQNVIFILNCFTNLAREENLKRHVDQVAEMLVGYGFSQKNIFVCNLIEALRDKQEHEMMFGYPSYTKFREYIIHEMISSELTRKYKGIQKNWQRKISEMKKRTASEINSLQRALNNIEKQKNEIQETISAVKNIEIGLISKDNLIIDNDSLSEVFENWEWSVSRAYKAYRKGVFVHPRREAIQEALDAINNSLPYYNNEVYDVIYSYYQNCIDTVSYCGDDIEIDEPELDDPETALVVLDTINLERLMDEADTETNIFNQNQKLNYYTQKLTRLFNEGLEYTEDRINTYCKECFDIVSEYQEDVLVELDRQLNSLQDEKSIRAALGNASAMQKQIDHLEKCFNEIKFDV